ncbi:MAG TPA: carboxylating nicotinate-nucleotide diphosphorylase [Candidatus Acidoferrales bacterium]|nr:carboxylating nicotinate-nucleotide diphosphorylase [Candidatus Acidoferrales bacterium]
MKLTREQRILRALFRGDVLRIRNARYRRTVRALTDLLLEADLAPTDQTARALGSPKRTVRAAVISQQGGIAAGLDEFRFLLARRRLQVFPEKRDGDAMAPGDVLAFVEGQEVRLLGLERVGLNLLQRMSGVATTARCLQERAQSRGGHARVVGTRKTPWGLLDKRALHLGGAGTHRLGLGDAILIKNNHLALLAPTELEAVPLAIERVWKARREAAFIEVEVRELAAARAAAQTFRRLLEGAAEEYPCLLLLDNMTSDQIGTIVDRLQQEGLWNDVLIEASGGISETNIERYAASGVDAISLGALTHSARALDICLRIS